VGRERDLAKADEADLVGEDRLEWVSELRACFDTEGPVEGVRVHEGGGKSGTLT
jgi:hypothetical protein